MGTALAKKNVGFERVTLHGYSDVMTSRITVLFEPGER